MFGIEILIINFNKLRLRLDLEFLSFLSYITDHQI